MAVGRGFRSSAVGTIPDDWDSPELETIAFVTSGKRLPLGSSLADRPTPHPYIRVTDMRPGTVDRSDIRYVPEEVFPTIRRYRIYTSDLFISVAGTLGIVGKIPSELDGANLTENADRITDIQCDRDFLMHVLLSPIIQSVVESIRTVGAQPKLALTRIRKFRVPLPPTKAEQEAIAKALSDADALIASLEQLIAKKRLIKQGVMQELLTGKRRLPGFETKPGFKQTEVGSIPVDWACALIADVLTDISMGPFGSDIKVSNFVSEGVPVLSGANIRTERLRDGFTNFVTEAKARSLKKAVAGRGDLVVTHRGTLGQVAYIPNYSQYERYVISQSQFRAHFKPDVAPCWIALFFHSPTGSKSLLEGKGHTGVPAIAQATTTFRKLHVPLPTKEEQQAITDVSRDLNAGIQTEEARLDKARQLKQGMMQQLLTGRIRLT